MSMSPAQSLPQIKAITSWCAEVKGTTVVQSTNKRVIVRCVDNVASRELAFLLNDRGHAVEVKRGLKSSAYYVQAYLN